MPQHQADCVPAGVVEAVSHDEEVVDFEAAEVRFQRGTSRRAFPSGTHHVRTSRRRGHGVPERRDAVVLPVSMTSTSRGFRLDLAFPGRHQTKQYFRIACGRRSSRRGDRTRVLRGIGMRRMRSDANTHEPSTPDTTVKSASRYASVTSRATGRSRRISDSLNSTHAMSLSKTHEDAEFPRGSWLAFRSRATRCARPESAVTIEDPRAELPARTLRSLRHLASGPFAGDKKSCGALWTRGSR